MTIHWHTEDSPADAEDPTTGPRPSRRRTVLATLAALTAVGLLVAGALAFIRQQRLAEARRDVLGVVRVAQEAVATEDRELLSSVLADTGSSSLHALRLMRGAKEPVVGLDLGMAPPGEPNVRFASSRRWGQLDRAEVDVRRLVSDSLGSGQLVQRYALAQMIDGGWLISPPAEGGRREVWKGAVLRTEVVAGDAAIARPIHEILDRDLAGLCRVATSSAEYWPPWQHCRFALTSYGIPPDEPERIAVVLPGPPGIWSAGDAAGEALLARSLARELLKNLFALNGLPPRNVSAMDEALIEAWLVPDAAAIAPVRAAGDWAKLADAVDGPRWDGTGDDAASAALARRMALDIRSAAGRDAVASVLGSDLPLSVRLNASLAPDVLASVLGPWAHAPTPFPADRALLASCVVGTYQKREAFVIRPGARDAVRAASLACPGHDVLAAAWRPGSADLTVACVDPRVGDSAAALVDVTVSEMLGAAVMITRAPGVDAVFPAGMEWSPDGHWLGGRGLHAGPWLWSAEDGAVMRSIGNAGHTRYPFQYDYAPAQWSPSARWLAFGQATEQDALAPDDVVVWSPESSEAAWRTPGEAATWSPVAEELAVLRRGPEVVTIRVLNGASGRELHRVALRRDEIVPQREGEREYPGDAPAAVTTLGWSPDGRWVAWALHFDTQTTVVAWRPEDGALRTHAVPAPTGARSPDGMLRAPSGSAWQPDGKIRGWSIMDNLVTPDSTAPQWVWDVVTDSVAPAGPPATHWSPDGQWGAAGMAEGIVVTRAGETEPAWRSALRGCSITGWQPDARAETASAPTQDSEGHP